MVLLDSNIFIVDRFFPNDALYPQNRAFVDKLDSFEAAVSSYTLLEICGVAGFRLARRELESWLFRFTSQYPVLVLDVFGLKGKDAEEWWSSFTGEVAERSREKCPWETPCSYERQRIMEPRRSSPGTSRIFIAALV